MPSTPFRTIEIHQQAPAKPKWGESCNGCGICCAAEPCPIAYLFLFQRTGRCRALLWQEEMGRYVCGMVLYPDRYSRLIPKFARQWMGSFIATRIAAGIGCDSDIELSES